MSENIYNLEIFKWIEHDIIENIINNCEVRKYSKWDIIISEGNDSNGEWFIIKEWKVSINIDKKEIAQLDSWEIFWEIALLNEEPRTATVIAITDIEVIILSLSNLIEMINNDENKINKTIMHRIEENLNR